MRSPNAYLFLLTVLPYLLTVHGTLSPDSQKSKGKLKEANVLRGPQDKDVFGLGLVQPEPLAKDILANHKSYFKETGLRRFNGTTLGYVTPVSTFVNMTVVHSLHCLLHS